MSTSNSTSKRDVVEVAHLESQGKIDIQVNFTDSSDKPRHLLIRDMVKAETKKYIASDEGMSHLGKSVATSKGFCSALSKTGRILLKGKDLVEFFKTKSGKDALKEAIVEISKGSMEEAGSDDIEGTEDDSKMAGKSEVYDPNDPLSLQASSSTDVATGSTNGGNNKDKKAPKKLSASKGKASGNTTVPPKKVAPKKVAPKKVAPKKVAPKKVAPKKPSKSNTASKSTTETNVVAQIGASTPKRKGADNPNLSGSNKKQKVGGIKFSVMEDFEDKVPLSVVVYVSGLTLWDTLLNKKILASTGYNMKKESRTEFFELCYYCHARFGRFPQKEAIQLYFENWCSNQNNITREEQAVLDTMKQSHGTKRAIANAKLYAQQIDETRKEFHAKKAN